jgi:hypothetical protein
MVAPFQNNKGKIKFFLKKGLKSPLNFGVGVETLFSLHMSTG